MNSTSHDAQTRRPDAPRVDEPHSRDVPQSLIVVDDPTEDLANDVTSELLGSGAGPGKRLQIKLPQLAASDSVAANDESGGAVAAIATGAVLRDRYCLGPPLGYGGTSIVFKARDSRRAEATGEGAEVAIKLLRPEFRDQPHCIARLKREFHQTQSITHPNVVRFHDLDCDQGSWFIAMELLDGEALGRRLRRESPAGLPAGEALRIAAACGDALAFAHDHGVTHGDVKPDNVFLTASGEVRLLDFGVAPDSVEPPHPEFSGNAELVRAAATRAYASPEVLSGQSPQSKDDVFSLACLIYEMLTGKHPYGRRGADVVPAMDMESERPAGVSERQWRAIAAGLAWRRDARPEIRELLRGLGDDAPEFAAVLAATSAQAPAVAAAMLPARIVDRHPLPVRRRWLGPAVIGFAVILGVLIGRFSFDSQSDMRSEGSVLPATAAPDAGISPPERTLPAAESAALVRPNPALQKATDRAPVAAGAPRTSTPGLVAFDSGTMTVSRRAVVAPVPVRHFATARRSVTVAWRVLDGSAVAGRDYGGPQSGVARFSEGHTFRMIFVPLLGDAKATGDRSFTVELTKASPGASLGVTQRIVVTILGDA